MKFFVMMGIILLVPFILQAGLFDDAASGGSAEKPDKPAYELNGFVRGTYFGGKEPETDYAETKSQYGEAALKINVNKVPYGDAYTELRYRAGNEFNMGFSEMDLREAYVNAYIGPIDIRLGKQIVVWGRADGINPTSNITPQNMLVRSPDEDDRRLGNFLVRSFLNYNPIRIEGIWVPMYASSVLPLSMLPENISMEMGPATFDIPITASPLAKPTASMENSSGALKLNLELPKFDGSVSYYYGINPLPGIEMNVVMQAGLLIPVGIQVKPVPYRMHVAGMDFSTTAGSLFGVRGEAAWRIPDADYDVQIHIPNPDVQLVLGLDKEIGKFNGIIQYFGRYVLDYKDIDSADPSAMAKKKSRMFLSQRDELSHILFTRLAWNLMHDLMVLEISGMYNVTTEEALARPKVSYDIADDLSVTAGAEIYTGPENTLYDLMEEKLSAGFVELRMSF